MGFYFKPIFKVLGSANNYFSRHRKFCWNGWLALRIWAMNNSKYSGLLFGAFLTYYVKFFCATHYIVFFYADWLSEEKNPSLLCFCTLKLLTAPVTLSVNSPNLVQLFISIQTSLIFTTKQLWYITFYSPFYSLLYCLQQITIFYSMFPRLNYIRNS